MAERIPGLTLPPKIPGATRKAQDPALAKWIGLSLLLHALLVVPVVLVRHLPPTPVAQQQLAVELFGMVSNRQAEARQLGERSAQPMEKPRPKIMAQARREENEKRLPQSLAESPVQVAKAEAQMAEAQVATPSLPRGEDEQQKQQTLSNTDPQADAFRKYLALLKKAIKAKLIYPQEAKLAGQTGTPVISFRIGIDGQIEPNSLLLRKSSGYPLLDDNALRAARAATPLPPPPSAITLALDIAFAEEKNR
ncbi:MAG: hypothetical protein H6R19_201 [Proteobacteria bacterium]|nr:hypothetical protein [Pseudomonadota bacterium]